MRNEEQFNARLDRATRGYREDHPHSYDLRNESIAFALATGIAPLGSCAELDADIDRAARRARWARRKARG